MFPELTALLSHPDNIALVLSVVVALGIGAQWLAWYLKQPSIIFLLVIGIVIGPVLGVFNPDQVLGDMLFPFISLGVAVILFEGSLTLTFDEMRNHGKVVQNLVSVGVFISILVITCTTYLLFDMDPIVALLFGALVCVTGPTVIVPMLRSVRPNKNISNVLKWEGIIIDPIGAIAVVLVYEYIVLGGSGNPFLLFGKIILVAGAIGIVGAAITAFVVNRFLIPEFLRNTFILAFVLFLFSISNYLEHESGLLTVTIMGVALANWPRFPKDDILHFNESLSVLLISILFIVLAARVDLGSIAAIGIPGIILLAVVMFIARPAAVWASSYKSSLTFSEKAMITWIGPRGIVAAAISSLFFIRLQDYDLKGVDLLVPLVFVIIAGTVIVQSLGAKIVAKILGVREPAANGVLIVGSNSVALKIAKALKDENIDVLMAHNNFTNISKARMEGINCYYGNPVSEHAEQHLDFIGTGHMLAMSVDQELNSLSELHFKHDFGDKNIHRLDFKDSASLKEREKIAYSLRSQLLFGKEITYAKLASMIANDAKVKVTRITNTYTYAQYCENNTDFVPMFFIDTHDVLHVVNSKNQTQIPNDVRLLSLALPEKQVEEQQQLNL